MTRYNIDDGVPIPKATNRGDNIKLLRGLIPIRQSVFFKGANINEIYKRFYNPAKRNGMTIIVRKVDGGVRLWRES